MIVVTYDRGVVTWADGRALVTASPAEARRVERLFTKPATVRESVVEEGMIGEAFVRVKPGSARHARGVLYTLPGVRLVVDDEPT